MAYFGRKPKKPGSVPQSQSGFEQEERLERVLGRLERGVEAGRPARSGRAVRALRGGREARSAR